MLFSFILSLTSGEIIRIEGNDYTVKCMHGVGGNAGAESSSRAFAWPKVDDIVTIGAEYILSKLDQPEPLSRRQFGWRAPIRAMIDDMVN
jgi:hypothetical protein